MCDKGAERTAKKRKRPKTFLSKAKKYGKRGKYGMGSELDANTYQYFVSVIEDFRGLDTAEEKSLLVKNVFEETINKEIDCSCNQVGCRVIEMMFPYAEAAVLERYITALGADLRPLCSDRFASHVLEALLNETCSRSLKPISNEDLQIKCKEFTLKLSKFLLNNLEDYIWDTYGNHIIRRVFENLLQLPKENKKKNAETTDGTIEIPEEYIEVVQEYGKRLITWPQFKEFPYSELTSGLLQVLLKGLRRVDIKLLKKYLNKILDEHFSDEINETGSGNFFESKPALMLLEVAIETAMPKTFTKIYCKCFRGKLPDLSKTRVTNFAVQKLLSFCSEKVEFEAMFEELYPHFEEIIDAGHTGVMLSLAQSCKRLSAKQGSFMEGLMKALHCLEPAERQNSFIICLCKFNKYEKAQDTPIKNLETEKLNLHGTLILQLLLEFNKPIKIVNGILSMESNQLQSLFSNSMGSHIIDSYVSSQYVGEKSREKLFKKLQGTYQKLACSRYGSRSFEAVWNRCSFNFKLSIMDELLHKEGLWSNSEFGKIIAGKVNLPLYKRNKEKWKNSLNTSKKVEELTDMLK